MSNTTTMTPASRTAGATYAARNSSTFLPLWGSTLTVAPPDARRSMSTGGLRVARWIPGPVLHGRRFRRGEVGAGDDVVDVVEHGGLDVAGRGQGFQRAPAEVRCPRLPERSRSEPRRRSRRLRSGSRRCPRGLWFRQHVGSPNPHFPGGNAMVAWRKVDSITTPNRTVGERSSARGGMLGSAAFAITRGLTWNP